MDQNETQKHLTKLKAKDQYKNKNFKHNMQYTKNNTA